MQTSAFTTAFLSLIYIVVGRFWVAFLMPSSCVHAFSVGTVLRNVLFA